MKYFLLLLIGSALASNSTQKIVNGNKATITGIQNTVELSVIGVTAQTGDLQQWKNSNGTVVGSVSATGYFTGVNLRGPTGLTGQTGQTGTTGVTGATGGPPTLTTSHIFMGSGASVASDVVCAGDVTCAVTGSSGTVTVNSIQGAGAAVTNTADTILKRDGGGGIRGTQVFSNNVTLNAGGDTIFLMADYHWRISQSGTTTATVNANAGTGATCTLSKASDLTGQINLTTTATAPAAGIQCTVNFANTWQTASPVCLISAANGNAAASFVLDGIFSPPASTTVFTVNFTAADATGHAFIFNYLCFGPST